MVSVKKKIINGNTYYYLEQSFRKNGKIDKKEKYLGTALPERILPRNMVQQIRHH
jgi:hypothetical protein